jgi:hypothetical protein
MLGEDAEEGVEVGAAWQHPTESVDESEEGRSGLR